MQITLRPFQFLFSALVLLIFAGGVLVAFTLPPFQVPDEPVHWGVTIQRTEKLGALIGLTHSDCSVTYALSNHFDTSRIAFDKSARMYHGKFQNLRSLQALCDAPHVSYGGVLTYPGLLLARLVVPNEHKRADRAISLFYLGRLLQGLLFVSTLIWFVLLPMRSGEYRGAAFITLAGCLSPLLLQQAFGISADGVTLMLAVMLAGLLLYWDKLSRFEFGLIALLACVTGFTKPPLFPLVPLAIFGAVVQHFNRSQFSWQEFKGQHRWRITLSLIVVLSSFVATLYSSLQDHSVPAHQIMGRNLDARAQLEFMTTAPAVALTALHEGLVTRLNFEALANNLGWLSLPLSRATNLAFQQVLVFAFEFELLLLIAAWLLRHREGAHTLPQRFLTALVLTAGLYVVAILTPLVMYLTWTEVGASAVQGLQGRYFFPALLVLPAMVAAGVGPRQGISFVQVGAGRARYFFWALALLALPFLIFPALLLLPQLYQDIMGRYW
jgi:hypothetical protein